MKKTIEAGKIYKTRYGNYIRVMAVASRFARIVYLDYKGVSLLGRYVLRFKIYGQFDTMEKILLTRWINKKQKELLVDTLLDLNDVNYIVA